MVYRVLLNEFVVYALYVRVFWCLMLCKLNDLTAVSHANATRAANFEKCVLLVLYQFRCATLRLSWYRQRIKR